MAATPISSEQGTGMNEFRSDRSGNFPGFAILLGFIVPFSLAALLSDWRFYNTFEVQWLNMADWMVTGSLIGGGLALAWYLVHTTIRGLWKDRPHLIAAVLLAVFVVLQFLNALTHAKDNFATMPGGLIMSIITTIVAIAAAYMGFRHYNRGIVQ